MLSFLVCALLGAQSPIAAPILPDQPRIAWVGSTWVEREQEHSHFETALHLLKPGSRIVFRNLGWSGDTVFGESRAGFGSVEDGYKALIKQISDARPNLILLGYGFNESFEGQKGLAGLKKQYIRLVNDLKPLNAPIYLMGIPRAINRPPELTREETILANRDLYNQAIRSIASETGVGFLEMDGIKPLSAAHTSNGIHLTGEGYRALSGAWLEGLGLAPLAKPFVVSIDAGARDAQGATIEKFTANAQGGWDFALRPDQLRTGGTANGVVRFPGLREGRWVLKQGSQVVAEGTAQEWAEGKKVVLPGVAEQAEAVRREVVRKNREFFYRWRPQNETYLFGFRKHEQGQNAREIPQFDPIVEEAEKRIASLTQPKFQDLILVPAR